MKKYKIMFSLLGLSVLCSVTAPIITSCSKQNQPVNYMNTTVSKYYIDFVNQNHGRWAGNISNFSNILPNNTGLSSNSKPLYDLDTKIDYSVNNYGSYHAYLWLINQIKQMGYESLNNIQDIKQAKIDQDKITPDPSTKLINIGSRSIITNNEFNNNLFTKTGIVTQTFLWNGSDRANGVNKTYNNLGNNIITTIAPANLDQSNVGDFYLVAHYDSTATGEKKTSWGATDNATGVAVNLAILKYFSNPENQKNLKVRLHVLFVDAEEVGVLGSNAFVYQSVVANNTPLTNNIGMVNLDTVAGGDYLYVHSPNTNPKLSSDNKIVGNTNSIIRDQINALSIIRSKETNDIDQILQIHPQVEKGQYLPGETGDWSDHTPFYKVANMPIAYLESTNFQLKSKYDVFDGYSQTTNKNAWILKDGNMPTDLFKYYVNGSILPLWTIPKQYTLNDFVIKGDIWHNDIDRIDWLDQNIGITLYKQINTIYETLLLYLQTIELVG